MLAQSLRPSQLPKSDSNGVYEIAISDLNKLDSSPKVEFPRELAAYEVADKVTIALTISPQGKVTKAKAVGGKIDALIETAEKTVNKWAFQPHVANGRVDVPRDRAA